MAKTRIPSKKVGDESAPETETKPRVRASVRAKAKEVDEPELRDEAIDPIDEDELDGPTAAAAEEVEAEMDEGDEDDDGGDFDALDEEVGDEPAPQPAAAPLPTDKRPKPTATATHGRLTVTRHFPDGSEDGSEETLEVRQFASFPAVVKVSYGTTINLGNFQSAKVNVGVELPCYVEEIDEAYAFGSKFVESRLSEEVEMVRTAMEPAGELSDDDEPAPTVRATPVAVSASLDDFDLPEVG